MHPISASRGFVFQREREWKYIKQGDDYTSALTVEPHELNVGQNHVELCDIITAKRYITGGLRLRSVIKPCCASIQVYTDNDDWPAIMHQPVWIRKPPRPPWLNFLAMVKRISGELQLALFCHTVILLFFKVIPHHYKQHGQSWLIVSGNIGILTMDSVAATCLTLTSWNS